MDHLQIDLDKLQQIQDSFSLAAHVFAFCVDENGKKLTTLSGDKEEARLVMALVNPELLADMLGRVMTSRVEDQVIEETNDSDVRVACLSIKVKASPLINWIVYANFGDKYKTKTTHEGFLKSLDLLRVGAKTVLNDRFEAVNAMLESERSHSQETELMLSLKKSQAMTEIVRFLESEDNIEDVLDGVLKIAGRTMDFSNAVIIRQNKTNNADVIGEYTSADSQILYENRIGIPIPEYSMAVERCVAISSDTKISDGMRENLMKHGIEAIVMIPLVINGKNEMTACFIEMRRVRVWNREEIKFLGEITHILQDIIVKRIQQNSLESSYVSLKRILDNLGCGIIVKDVNERQILFANSVIKQMFLTSKDDSIGNNYFIKEATENRTLELDADFSFSDEKPGVKEVYDSATERWFDLHYTRMKWVDGRDVALFSFYDITDKKAFQKKASMEDI